MDTDAAVRKTISANVRRLMDERGWTETDVAKAAKVSQSTVNRILKAVVGTSSDKIAALGRAFRVDAWELLLSAHPSNWDQQTLQWSLWFQKLKPHERKKFTIMAMLTRDGAADVEVYKEIIEATAKPGPDEKDIRR